MIDPSPLKNKSERLFCLPVILTLLCFFVIFGIINFAGFERLCTADMYEDTVIAKMMWEQKTLFPLGTVFGNQFYVVATPVLSGLLYGLTGRLNDSMALATTLMSVLTLAALAWMLRPFAKSSLTVLCAMLALVGGVFAPDILAQEQGQLFFVMASFYACYLICFFVVLGDYVRALISDGRRPVALGLSLFLCFCTGMQSLRQTCITVLPIIAFELLLALRRRLGGGAMWDRAHRRSLGRCLSYAAANGVGVALIKLLDEPHHIIYSGQSIFSGASLGEKLRSAAHAFRSISGLEFFGNGNGTFFTVIGVFFLLILAAAAVLVLRKARSAPEALPCYWWLTLISLAAVVCASMVTSVKLRAIYLFTYYPLLVFSLALVLDALKGKARYALVLALCLVTLANAWYSYHDNIDTALDDTPTVAQQVCDYAMENGFQYVYGSHSAAAPYVAVCSDGALLAGSWEDDAIFKAIPYMNPQYIYAPWDYDKAIYVFMPWELEASARETAGNGAVLTVQGQFGYYTVCTSSRQIMYPLTWVIPEK